ncbi:hypothetical protein BKA61DRAFT_478706 [Leptodontidium sp. MPI-SDFR-AT-0119]|nr:hypothetical protein BKA61DRAFT_478706 [Leptodontidium sp. MPI-SDFR-AT-0119]
MSFIKAAAEPPPGVIADLENPQDVLRTVNLVVQSLCIVFVSVTVLLRMYTRAVVQKTVYREDCKSSFYRSARVCFFLVYMSATMTLSFYGGGYHEWEVAGNDMKNFNLVSYVGVLTYGPTALLIKVSLLLITTRIFYLHQKTVISLNVLLAMIVIFYVSMQFFKIFICSPISKFWDPITPGKCFNKYGIYLADTVASVITDVAILAHPIPLVRGLNIPKSQKIKVYALLAAGGVATAASIARLAILLTLKNKADITLNVIALNLPRSAEASIGLICASLPALNILFTRRRQHGLLIKVKTSEADMEAGKLGLMRGHHRGDGALQ